MVRLLVVSASLVRVSRVDLPHAGVVGTRDRASFPAARETAFVRDAVRSPKIASGECECKRVIRLSKVPLADSLFARI
jgi:hypothetical protein